MPASPATRLDALRLANAEIQGRVDLQHRFMERVDTKLQATIGFAVAAAAFVGTRHLG